MRLLLDTHAFIWLDIARNQLSVSAQEAIRDPENSLYLSLASVWEMQIKMQSGKLHLNSSLQGTIWSQQKANRIELLPIELAHILALAYLPHHQNDPFDRLLIAQAQVEGLTLVTNDSKIGLYAVPQLW
jgi:PIN domain nuclease of toxin-antitoxin system